ncbi:hypothetical protein MKW98_032021 [Papaver atlanticum]|uniref:Uncharacterized protein n=1 Tax=Papaver atlanticum TaxID=357466 RepID=A0AAD4SE06_9MAGN|nr:hypothetical protein MKW98_032021 [Papaver atlanticum]
MEQTGTWLFPAIHGNDSLTKSKNWYVLYSAFVLGSVFDLDFCSELVLKVIGQAFAAIAYSKRDNSGNSKEFRS